MSDSKDNDILEFDEDTLKDKITQYNLLRNDFKVVYPLYKFAEDHAGEEEGQISVNNEYTSEYNRITKEFDNLYNEVLKIENDLTNVMNHNDTNFKQKNCTLKKKKREFNSNKQELEVILDKDNGAQPREAQMRTKLRYKYIDFFYISLLLGIITYSLHKITK